MTTKIINAVEVLQRMDVTLEETQRKAEEFWAELKGKVLAATGVEPEGEVVAVVETLVKLGFVAGAGWMRFESAERTAKAAQVLTALAEEPDKLN